MNDSQTEQVVFFGATSEVAQQVIRLHAEKGDRLRLIARNKERLDAVAQDAATRGAEIIETVCSDLGDIEEIGTLTHSLTEACNEATIWYFFQGVLPNQKESEGDWQIVQDAIDTNFTGIAKSLHYIANHIEQHSGGTVVVITSVAGLRGRQSNYIYGTSKGSLNIYLQGLRNRLYKSNGHVLTVMPGFIKTGMTDGFDRDGPLWATPEQVANDIYRSMQRRRNICYTPWFWRYIMLIIQHIPEFVFKRLKL